MPKVKVGGDVSLYVEDTAKSGRPIVFIHGWPLSQQMFEYQFMQLHRQGYRCFDIDLRGFGRSDKPWSNGYTYDTFADDIEGVMTALDLHDAMLVGFSMGGAIAMRYATKYLPSDRVSRIVFMEPPRRALQKERAFPTVWKNRLSTASSDSL